MNRLTATDQMTSNNQRGMLSRRTRLSRALMALVAAGSFALAPNLSDACDQCGATTSCQTCVEPSCGTADAVCGCELSVGCDSCESGCDSCGTSRKRPNPVFRALDGLAGGIEKVFGLDKCKKSCGHGCDDICDAGFAQELMTPIDSAPVLPDVHYAPPTTAPTIPQAPPLMPPPIQTQPRIVQPTAPLMDTTPRSIEPYQPQYDSLGTPTPIESVPRSVPPTPEPALREVTPRQTQPLETPPTPREAVPTPRNTSPVTPPADSGQPKKPDSIFDSLDDPFGDDEVRLRKPYRSVRPTNYQELSEQLQQRRAQTARQQASASSLRPAPRTKRPAASNSAPAPMSTQRVLAPYRRSR